MPARNPVPIQQRPWRDWYNFSRWRRRRAAQLREHPLCKLCLERGVLTPAAIADHVKSHRGNWNEFMLGALQSLCKECHDKTKRLADIEGYRQDIGADGWPLDPKHPANAKRPP